jgi:uncharacterized protein
VTPAEFRHRYGPWAVVIGGSDGIGAAFASNLARRKLNLVLVARRQDPLERLALALAEEHGVQIQVVVADVSTRAGVAAVARTGKDVGLLVCNAASAPVSPFLELTSDQLDAMLDLNCRAAAQLSRSYAAAMAARGRGGIVLLSSMAGNQGAALVAHYAATKAYLRVLAEGLWAELRPAGVDVLACCPGLVRTPTFERGDRSRPAGWCHRRWVRPMSSGRPCPPWGASRCSSPAGATAWSPSPWPGCCPGGPW